MTLVPAFVLPLIVAAAAAVGGGFLGVYVTDSEAGPIVQSVIPDTPAARAGFAAGDRFVSVNGKATPNSGAFLEILGSHDPGDAVVLKFVRGGASLEKRVVLGKRPANLEGGEAEEHQGREEEGEEHGEAEEKKEKQEKKEQAEAKAAPGLRARGGGRAYLGVQVGEADGGVSVESVIDGSPAARAGLADGDVIVRVAGADVEDIAGLSAALGKAKVGDRTDVVVRRGDRRLTLKVQLGERSEAAVTESVPPVAAPERPREPRAEVRRDRRAADAAAAEKKAEAGDEASAISALRREIRELRREIAELRKIVDKLDR